MNAQTFHAAARRPILTRGQLQIVERAVLGETIAEIAARFGIGVSSVEGALFGARQRLHARNTAHLCALAVALEIVDPAPLRAAAEFAVEGRR